MSKNFELLQQIGKEHNLFYTSGAVSTAVKTADEEPAPAVEVVPRRPEAKSPTTSSRSLNPVQEKPKKWARELPGTTPPRALGSERITRREEFKLAQRIFPNTGSAQSQRAPQVVLFSGAERGQAAGTISARTCEILASRGDGLVCAVDASFTAPFLHRYFGLANSKGLSESLSDPDLVQEFIHNVPNTKLWVMPAGIAKIDLMGSEVAERLTERVADLRRLFKYVVVHGRACSDHPVSLQTFGADGVVLVVEAHSTRRDAVRELMEELRLQGTPILGIVLNNRTFPIPDAIYRKL